MTDSEMTGPIQARSALADAYLNIWPAPCPWPPCKAPRGSPCVSATGERLQDVHPSRAEALATLAADPDNPAAAT